LRGRSSGVREILKCYADLGRLAGDLDPAGSGLGCAMIVTRALAMHAGGNQARGLLPATIDRASAERLHHGVQVEVDHGPRSVIPLEIIKKIQLAGANLEEPAHVDEIHVLDLDYPSQAYNQWKQFCLPNNVEPADCEKSDPRYIPAMYFNNGVSLQLQGPLYCEVADLLSVYAPLRQEDFQPGARQPALPSAHIQIPPYGVTFRHATFGAHKVFERISNGSGCPVIGSLTSGSTICRVNVFYSNCAVSVRVIKA
jgi:hypothetical protein